MPFIQLPKAPDSLGEGRQARGVSYQADSGAGWVAEVDEVGPGEKEISEQVYRAALVANEAHNDALPEPEPPAASPFAAILAKADADVSDAELRTLTLAMARRTLA